MAGSINISSDVIWAESSMAIDTVADLTRREFSPECQKYAELIYSDLDGGFMLISLCKLEPQAFNCFAQANRRAFERFRGGGAGADWPPDFYPGMLAIWTDLLNKLEKDPRFRRHERP